MKRRLLIITLIMMGVTISILINMISVLKGIELLWVGSILIFIVSFWSLFGLVINGKDDIK